jgi:phospholipase C
MTRAAPLSISLAFLAACGGALPPDSGEQALTTKSAIRHLVVIVQENHSFDTYFGRWCTAPAGSQPTCTKGSGCCEAAPDTDPGTGAAPVALTDSENAAYSPDHSRACEDEEMNGGRMDGYGTARCGSRRNFALAGDEVAQYRAWAKQYALADRYFQPLSGASSSNDMYLSTARYMFTDNAWEPAAIGAGCSYNQSTIQYMDVTVSDLLAVRGQQLVWYAEGYRSMVESSVCPLVPDDCTSWDYFPCIYDPSDIPSAYFASSADRTTRMRDYTQLGQDLANGTLPAVSFVKGLAYHNEHPAYGTTITAGVEFVARTVREIQQSKYGADTLILITWDESGGYFDHVAPPAPSSVDGQPYGPRVPLIAIGPQARKGHVSHAVLEHSSIVKFIEWNWLGVTGLLKGRDAVVNNLGSLLDPALGVPEQ